MSIYEEANFPSWNPILKESPTRECMEGTLTNVIGGVRSK